MKTSAQLSEEQAFRIMQGFSDMEQATEENNMEAFKIITAQLLQDVTDNIILHHDILMSNQKEGH